MEDHIKTYIDATKDALTAVSDDIWRFAELGLVEKRSASAQIKYLRDNGFQVETGVGNMDTAFIATWGSGGPVIGFLGEYDALPGVSNRAVPRPDPVNKGACGHGCGHNLLGVASMGAAAAVKEYAIANSLPGTVRYYGCPAEESSFGKTWMAKAGAFDGADIVLTWHPGSVNSTDNTSSLADLVYKFDFHGKTAHAAGDPYNGRSALDGVELMNDGIERMREHIHPDNRIHYVITHGGGAPNVVPDYAQNFFDIRATNMDDLAELYAWVEEIAKGAAMMTQTRCEPRFFGGAANLIPNTVITRVFQNIMEESGGPVFGPDDFSFAREMQANFDPVSVRKSLEETKKRYPNMSQTLLCDFVLPYDPVDKPGKGSTDVADVSWIVPTGQFRAACFVLGAPGHSWAVTSCSGMSIGHKGMLFAAEVLGKAGVRFMTDKALRDKAWAEFRGRLDGKSYRSPIPQGIDIPPLPFEE